MYIGDITRSREDMNFITFRRFPKILQNMSEGHINVAEYFPKIFEDVQGGPGDVSIIHQRI